MAIQREVRQGQGTEGPVHLQEVLDYKKREQDRPGLRHRFQTQASGSAAWVSPGSVLKMGVLSAALTGGLEIGARNFNSSSFSSSSFLFFLPDSSQLLNCTVRVMTQFPRVLWTFRM